MNIQARVALDKVRHPERYCPERRCLWRTGGAHCPRHEDVLVPVHRLQAVHDAGSMDGARTAAGHRPHGERFKARLAKPVAGVLTPHAPPAVHTPPMMKSADDVDWRPLLTGLDGGAR